MSRSPRPTRMICGARPSKRQQAASICSYNRRRTNLEWSAFFIARTNAMTIKKSPQTALIHTDYQAPQGFAAFPSAIHHASTVLFKNVAAMRSGEWKEKSAYTYGLHGTPTTFTLEARLAEIEDGKFCLLAPSGLAAIAMVDFALLKSGDDVLLPDNVYNPNRELGKCLTQDFGVTARYYDPLIGAGIAALIQPNTKLIWTEAPGSVSMEVPDLPAICRAAHDKGVLVALDNTWSAGLALRGFELGVDIIMQALTKYQSGGSDVLMGAVITRDQLLHERRRRISGAARPADDEAALRRARRRRAQAGRVVQDAAGNHPGAAPGAGRLSRPRYMEARLQRRRRLVLGAVRRALHGAADRPLRRRAELVRHRLQLGRRQQPGDAVPDTGHSRGMDRPGYAGAFQRRPRRCRRFDRRYRARFHCDVGLGCRALQRRLRRIAVLLRRRDFEATLYGLAIGVRRLRLDEQADHFRMRGPDLAFDIDHQFLDARRLQVVVEFKAEGDQDLVRRQLRRQHAVGLQFGNAGGDAHDGIAQMFVGALADQQAFAFARQQRRRRGQHQADRQRGDAVGQRHLPAACRIGAGGRDQDAQQGGAVFEQHHEGGRVFAFAESLVIAERSLRGLEFAQRHHPRHALERKRQRQHDVVDRHMLDRRRLAQMADAFVDGDAGAQREHQQRDDKTPEIQFAAVADRMVGIGRARGAPHAVQQQYLVAAIDEGVHRLAEHGRAATKA